jgi:aspartate racemase
MHTYDPQDNTTLIIGGGVGPMAGVELHRTLIEQTFATGDPDHLDVVHVSAARTIGDRTAYLLEEGRENPGSNMAAAVSLGLCGLVDGNGRLAAPAVVGVPCNTFHAPVIYEQFALKLRQYGPGLQLLHMLEETLGLIRQRTPAAKTLGLMSTTGTRRSGVWHHILEGSGYRVVEVSEEDQEALHATIYHREWGLKAVSPASDTARRRLEGYARQLIDAGAELLVPGCTEIPLALPGQEFEGVPLIDPVLALARGMIAAADPEKLRPLQS